MTFLLVALIACSSPDPTPVNPEPDPEATVVTIETSMGSFEMTLFDDEAPLSSENFLTYVDEGFYDGSDGLGAATFHRVIADFMVQGGGSTESGEAKETHPSIDNEAIDSGLTNARATVAMARLNDPDTATSQFFVNVVDNEFLDPGEMTPDGYAVFAQVTSGMDIVDAIAAVATDESDVPLDAVIIEVVTRNQ
jgi:peptidyl-prolyl cis-trans isomerase A (cyclophilin A)